MFIVKDSNWSSLTKSILLLLCLRHQHKYVHIVVTNKTWIFNVALLFFYSCQKENINSSEYSMKESIINEKTRYPRHLQSVKREFMKLVECFFLCVRCCLKSKPRFKLGVCCRWISTKETLKNTSLLTRKYSLDCWDYVLIQDHIYNTKTLFKSR